MRCPLCDRPLEIREDGDQLDISCEPCGLFTGIGGCLVDSDDDPLIEQLVQAEAKRMTTCVTCGDNLGCLSGPQCPQCYDLDQQEGTNE